MGAQLLDLAYGLGYRATEDAATVVGDEEVVLDADSTEILICLELVEVDEVLVEAFCTPFVDESGDEIYSWLVGDNETGLQGLTAA